MSDDFEGTLRISGVKALVAPNSHNFKIYKYIEKKVKYFGTEIACTLNLGSDLDFLLFLISKWNDMAKQVNTKN